MQGRASGIWLLASGLTLPLPQSRLPNHAHSPSTSHSSRGIAARSSTPNHCRARQRAMAQRAATARAGAGGSMQGSGQAGQGSLAHLARDGACSSNKSGPQFVPGTSVGVHGPGCNSINLMMDHPLSARVQAGLLDCSMALGWMSCAVLSSCRPASACASFSSTSRGKNTCRHSRGRDRAMPGKCGWGCRAAWHPSPCTSAYQ